MRKTRIGKRIYVQGVPLNTSWFCPYCCATVDTALLTLIGRKQNLHIYTWLTHPLGYSRSQIPSRSSASPFWIAQDAQHTPDHLLSKAQVTPRWAEMMTLC